VLRGVGHSGVTYNVSGPNRLSMRQVAEAFSRAAGRSIAYHAETIDGAYDARAHYGAPGWEVDGWLTSLAGVANGEMDVVSEAVLVLTLHAPMTLSAFLRHYPESYRPAAHLSCPAVATLHTADAVNVSAGCSHA
jgi:NAD(P)H dehydrogenase (quinone)